MSILQLEKLRFRIAPNGEQFLKRPFAEDPQRLLDTLQAVDWSVVARTYGNCHSTLIGLLVAWWISLDERTHSVLEAGPTTGFAMDTGRRGQCDAVLCQDDMPIGVLEVEGTRILHTAEKLNLGWFFEAARPEYSSLEFGIFLVYAYEQRALAINEHSLLWPRTSYGPSFAMSRQDIPPRR